jgi:tetratricopeptide (TPR) repeat protein
LNSRVALALLRLDYLSAKFPNDPDIAFCEGVIRIDYLGQGVAARELFEKAHNSDYKDLSAARNVTFFARDENDFMNWSKRSMKSPPPAHFKQKVDWIGSQLAQGIPYRQILLAKSEASLQNSEYGTAAALTELVLQDCDGLSEIDQLHARRIRAQSLRQLDKLAAARRRRLGEHFAPEERPALQDAVKEIVQILVLDEYDPEMWNYKSAWQTLLGDYEDAISAAETAIKLRPHNYPKPYVNKANALLKQGRKSAAIGVAHEAIKEAKKVQLQDDIALAQGIIQKAKMKKTDNDLGDLTAFVKQIQIAAMNISDQEAEQVGSVKGVAAGLCHRAHNTMDNSSDNYKALMAELLTDFTPESAFLMMMEVKRFNSNIYRLCMDAALYVTALSKSVLQRDAARFVCLSILGAQTKKEISALYRQVILEPSMAVNSPISSLNEIIQKEMGHIHPLLPSRLSLEPPTEINHGIAKPVDLPRTYAPFKNRFAGKKPRPNQPFVKHRQWSKREKSLLRRLQLNMVLYVLNALIFAYFGTKFNPNIDVDTGIFIGLATALIINRVIMNSFNVLKDSSWKQRAMLGFVWGVILGFSAGVTFGWGGGMTGDSLLWFIAFGTSSFGAGSALNAMINLRF